MMEVLGKIAEKRASAAVAVSQANNGNADNRKNRIK